MVWPMTLAGPPAIVVSRRAMSRLRRLLASALSVPLALGLVATPAPAAPATFTHPGVLVSRPQLDFVKAQVKAGAQPRKAAYDQAAACFFAFLSWFLFLRVVVVCGSYSNPNYGCTDEREDAIAAYTAALIWYISGDARYAQKAIALMDA